MERRNLTAAYKFYVGKELVGAHGAEADNDAALEVFIAQLDRYPEIPKDMDGLSAFCNSTEPASVDADGKLVWRDGEAFFNFGKHKCKSLVDVCKTDPGYLDWLVNKADFPKEFVEICSKARRGTFPVKPVPVPAPTPAPLAPVNTANSKQLEF
jgi:DNA polymerase-3 subunit epsilon